MFCLPGVGDCSSVIRPVMKFVLMMMMKMNGGEGGFMNVLGVRGVCC